MRKTAGTVSHPVLFPDISGEIFLTVGDRELIDSVKLRMAEVQADTLRVRAEASTEAEIRTLAADGSQLQGFR